MRPVQANPMNPKLGMIQKTPIAIMATLVKSPNAPSAASRTGCPVVSALAANRASSRLPEITASSWTGEAGRLAFAASLTVPALVLGGAAVGLGLWMAVVEWRGRFASKPLQKDATLQRQGIVDNLPQIFEAPGKLQGAPLLLVIGTVLLLGSVWVAGSTAAPAVPPSPSPTASPAKTG